MFPIMALKIGAESDKILREKNVLAYASPVFFLSKFCHPRRQFWTIIEKKKNMISPDHVLY